MDINKLEKNIERYRRDQNLDYNKLSPALKADIEKKAKELNISPEKAFELLCKED